MVSRVETAFPRASESSVVRLANTGDTVLGLLASHEYRDTSEKAQPTLRFGVGAALNFSDLYHGVSDGTPSGGWGGAAPLEEGRKEEPNPCGLSGAWICICDLTPS